MLIGGPTAAAPISYTGTLFPGEVRAGALPVAGNFDDPSSDVSGYYVFSASGGLRIEIAVQRVEAAFDPALWVFEGTFADDGAFAGGSDPRLDPLDPGFLAFGDDERPAPDGPFGDPLVRIRLTLPGNGGYTAIVTNFNSDPDDGDGLFPYRISLTIVPAPAALTPERLGPVPRLSRLSVNARCRNRPRRPEPNLQATEQFA